MKTYKHLYKKYPHELYSSHFYISGESTTRALFSLPEMNNLDADAKFLFVPSPEPGNATCLLNGDASASLKASIYLFRLFIGENIFQSNAFPLTCLTRIV